MTLSFDLNSFCSIEAHDGELLVTGTALDAPRALWTPNEPRQAVIGPFRSGVAAAVFTLGQQPIKAFHAKWGEKIS
jgi:hypothetical protein